MYDFTNDLYDRDECLGPSCPKCHKKDCNWEEAQDQMKDLIKDLYKKYYNIDNSIIEDLANYFDININKVLKIQ